MREEAAIRRWRVCVLTDRALARGRSHEAIVRAALAGGADAIQLRDKDDAGGALFADAVALRVLCRERRVPLIVNDRMDVALAADADGAHVGQDDLPARAARAVLGAERILGVSARTPQEAARAETDGADYIGAGPVFEARGTKPDAAPPIGLAGLAAICRATRLPVIAIGGIHAGNAREVRCAGATGVAVISAVVAAEDVATAVRALKMAMEEEP